MIRVSTEEIFPSAMLANQEMIVSHGNRSCCSAARILRARRPGPLPIR